MSKVREEEEVVEGDDGEGIPYDPNLVCPKWFIHFCIFFTVSKFQHVLSVCLLCDAKQSHRVAI